ncbi:MAG: hypothetical protein JWO60_1800, partial [Frankiales bacterium]|nr:hypothetical protein [Frankiales bacterium]
VAVPGAARGGAGDAAAQPLSSSPDNSAAATCRAAGRGTRTGYSERRGAAVRSGRRRPLGRGPLASVPRTARCAPVPAWRSAVSLLLLVRHGQASFGAADYDVLSPRGEQQATLLGRRLAPLAGTVQRVVTGTLRRQRDTARHLAAAAGLDLPVETDPGWDEYDVVDVLSGVPAQDVTDSRAFQLLLDEALLVWASGAADDAYRESWPVFSGRVSGALQRALDAPGTTLVVASAGSIGVAAAELLQLPAPAFTRLARVQVNTGLTKVVTGRQGSSLVSLNDHAHLEVEPGLVTYR